MKLFLTLFVCAAVLFADVSGKWAGTLTRADGHDGPAYMVLKQEGNTVTGSGGPNAERQYTITKGHIEGDKLTLRIEEHDMEFELTVKGDEISGEVRHEGERGKIALKRQ